MTKRKTIILKILFALIYCPLAAEIMVRVLDPVPMLPRYVCAAYYGIRGNEPNKTYWHQSAEYKVQMRTNSKGIRADYEIPYDKPQGTKRIVLLGDSFGMGYEADLSDTFTAKMVYHLETKYHIKNVEVVNLSTSGHGNAEELIVLQNEGLKYQPDLVLLAWHSTDYDDNFRSNLYVLNDEHLKRKAEYYLPGVEISRKLYSIPFYPLMADNSQLYNMVRDWAGRRVKMWLVAARSFSQKKAQSDQVDNIDLDHYKKQLTVALLDEIRLVTNQAGAAFAILDIPNCKSRTEFVTRFPYDEVEQTKPFHLVSPINKFAEANGKKVYWEKGHGHWTPLGCDMVGETLADYIYENQLLK